MTITYKPDHYIKGLNIHSVRDLFLPARVSADLDLTFPRQSKKSPLYKKAFLLLPFLEAVEGFTYTFDAHFLPRTPATVLLCLYTSWRLRLLHVNGTMARRT